MPFVSGAASLPTAFRGVETPGDAGRLVERGTFLLVTEQSERKAEQPERKAEQPDRKKLHRELDELLAELRVVIPGVTVLFAFLLAVPFSARFDAIESGERDAFFWLFLTTFGSLLFLVAPSVHHRIRFRAQERHFLIPMWNTIAIVGLFLMCAAYILAVYLVTSVVFSHQSAIAISLALGIPAVVLWFFVPLVRRHVEWRRRP